MRWVKFPMVRGTFSSWERDSKIATWANVAGRQGGGRSEMTCAHIFACLNHKIFTNCNKICNFSRYDWSATK